MNGAILKDTKVSTIIPVYNTEYLTDTVFSVLAQTHENLELIIVNDNTANHNLELFDTLTALDKRISILHNKINSGSSVSRNRGIYKASGQYIAALDADDIWQDKDKLKKQLDISLSSSVPRCVGTNYNIINQQGDFIENIELPEDNISIRATMNIIVPMLHSTLLMPKDVITKIGGYNYLCKTSQDHELMLRLGQYLDFYNIQEATTLYRLYPQNISSTKGFQQTYQALWNVISHGSNYPKYLRGIIIRILMVGVGVIRPYAPQSLIIAMKQYKSKFASSI